MLDSEILQNRGFPDVVESGCAVGFTVALRNPNPIEFQPNVFHSEPDLTLLGTSRGTFRYGEEISVMERVTSGRD